jgi:two-component system response regulator HydG
MTGHLLVVDDKAPMCELIEATLSPLGVRVTWTQDPIDALERIRRDPPDVVLTDVRMPSITGIELCARIEQIAPTIPVIVMTGFGTLNLAVEAIRAGAYDFLSKPIELDVLEFAVARALEHARLSDEVRRLNDTLRQLSPDPLKHRLIGSSPPIQRLLDMLPKVASADLPVLIEGETGTGKELLARDLHDRSPRAGGPFIPVNCAALPESLAESELFGHTEGAYTGAKGQRAGLFVQATGGTIFLDELGELPLSIQSKLLRVLQESTVRPVGSDREIPIDCRIISATNRDLKVEASASRFRSDLYFRVAVLKMHIPPLRDRRSDILTLAQHFNRRIAHRRDAAAPDLSKGVATSLVAYHWPGNVRELENAIERAVALCDGHLLTIEDLPEELWHPSARPEQDAGLISLAELETQHIRRVLKALNGNKQAAAKVLGLDRRTLYRKLERIERGGGDPSG